MKKFFNTLTRNCSLSATVLLLLFVLVPLEVVIVLTLAYCIAHATGVFKLKFPDVWELEENYEDTEKPHKIFLTVPTRIGGRWYVYCYVNRMVVDGKSVISIKPIKEVNQGSDTFEEVQDETIN